MRQGCAVRVSACAGTVFRPGVDPTADFGLETVRFRPETTDFGRKSDARMRHMCSIKGFSSIATVLDFSANSRISGGPRYVRLWLQNPPISGAKVTQICVMWRIDRLLDHFLQSRIFHPKFPRP
jgi:hypothetical protein